MVSWQVVSKSLGDLSIVSITTLFAYLFILSGMNPTFTGNSVCDQLECEAFINIPTSTWRTCFEHTKESQKVYLAYNQIYGGSNTKLTPFIYSELNEKEPVLYKKSTRGRTLWVNLNKVDNIIETQPDVKVDWLVPARGKGNWRPLKDGDCWDRGKINRIKLVAHSPEPQVIKWSFVLGEIDIDPLFVSWDYIYKNLSKQVPVYETETIIVSSVYTAKNDSWSRSYNYTEQIITGYKTVYYDGERIGLKVGNKEYDKNSNVDGDELVQYSIPVGDRNWDEYPTCRPDTIWKGVCTVVKII